MRYLYLIIVALFSTTVSVSCKGAKGPATPGDDGIINWTVHQVYAPPVKPANFSAYPALLAPHEVLIIRLPNHSESVTAAAGWWEDAIVYQVYTAAFNGGDLPTSRLDYIRNDVGADAIWTTPIFASTSEHGYDTTDYMQIKASFGGEAAFTEYVQAAHKRDMYVMLDYVINHTGIGHQWFQDSKFNLNGKTDWYNWQASIPGGWTLPWGGAGTVWHYGGSNGYYYGPFWSGMPDLNLANSEVMQEIKNIGSHYLVNKDVDGFRMDAIRYLIEEGPYPLQADTASTIAALADISSHFKAQKSDAMIVGEAWVGSSAEMTPYYNGGDGIDQAFHFQYYYQLLSTLNSRSKGAINSLINAKDPAVPWSFFSPFLDNHDNVYSGNNRMYENLGSDIDKIKLAFAITLTFPGTPYIYYGTEIGQAKGPQAGDIAKRQPLDWAAVDTQKQDLDSLLNTFKKYSILRRSDNAFSRGSIRVLTTDKNEVLAYLRSGSDAGYIIMFNLSQNAVSTLIDFTGSGLATDKHYTAEKVVLLDG